MLLVTGIITVVAASGIAMFVSDHFDLGGHLDEEEEQPASSSTVSG